MKGIIRIFIIWGTCRGISANIRLNYVVLYAQKEKCLVLRSSALYK